MEKGFSNAAFLGTSSTETYVFNLQIYLKRSIWKYKVSFIIGSQK